MFILKVRRKLKKIFVNPILEFRRKRMTESFPIVQNPDEKLERYYKIKDATWEDTYYPECYNLCKEQHLQIRYPAQYVYRSRYAVVTASSDVVLTAHGVYWDKYNQNEFCTWAEPVDKNVRWYNRDNIGILRYKKHEFIAGKTLSMIGVWSPHWGHCLYQFLPKLFIAGECGLLNSPINLLVDKSEDGTIMEMVQAYLKSYPQVKIKFAEDKIEYECEELYFMPSMGSSFNGCKYRLDYPYFIARDVLDRIKKYVIDPLIEEVKDDEVVYDKIFLPRGNHRTLSNYQEVSDYLKEKGFVELEGSKLTLREKASYFYHAKEVVGLYGSALINLMFGHGTKVMSLLNYRMSTDTSIYLQVRDYVSTYINVTGQDETEGYHTNYYIPLSKIEEVYSKYIHVDE